MILPLMDGVPGDTGAELASLRLHLSSMHRCSDNTR